MKMSHHATASGYDRLVDYLDSQSVPQFLENRTLRKGVAWAAAHWCERSGSQWYSRDHALLELDVAVEWRRTTAQVFHFLYGENCYRYAKQLTRGSRKANAMIATYHTPPNRFADVVANPEHIRDLDAVVLMSNSQRPAFENLIDSSCIHVVRHGVDTAYFCPAEPVSCENQKLVDLQELPQPITFICAGRMLRDYDTLAAAVAALAKNSVPVQFQILAPREIAEKFAGMKNVECLQGVTDDQLKLLYQSADSLVMPMHDCTANNVLLEGMASGLPVVATDLEGVRDYVNQDCADLVEKHDANGLAAAIERMASDSERRDKMARASRAQALELDWAKIAEQTEGVYKTVLRQI